jgi:hypothetical protein
LFLSFFLSFFLFSFKVEGKERKQQDRDSPSGFGTNNFVASINLTETRAPEMVSVTELWYRMMRSSAAATHRDSSQLIYTKTKAHSLM